MATYAVMENDKVINVIIADSKEVAESVVGKVCLEYTESNPAVIGATFDGTHFIPPKPESNPSWVYDFDIHAWVPPVPKPEGDFIWDEESLSWVEYTI